MYTYPALLWLNKEQFTDMMSTDMTVPANDVRPVTATGLETNCLQTSQLLYSRKDGILDRHLF